MNVGPDQVFLICCSVSRSSQCFFARRLLEVALSSVALKTPFGGEVLVVAETNPHLRQVMCCRAPSSDRNSACELRRWNT